MPEQRKALQGMNSTRGKFRGIFERYGEKRGWKGRKERTVLLKEISDGEGNLVADHLWFNLTRGFEDLGPVPGEKVEFEARVTPYLKGYRGTRDIDGKPMSVDYHLSRPTKWDFVYDWEEDDIEEK